jgi:hypothetical protein
VKAEYLLGVRSDHGGRVPQDYAQATAWFRKAAEQGDATALQRTVSDSRRRGVLKEESLFSNDIRPDMRVRIPLVGAVARFIALPRLYGRRN